MWSIIDVSEVLDELSPQEQSAFNTIQGASTTQQSILGRVVGEVRGNIIAGGNTLDQDGTVPDQLRNACIDITLWRWLKKFPSLKALQTPERKAAHDDAAKLLQSVAKREIKVEAPATPVTTQSGPTTPIRKISGNDRQTTRNQMKGL